MRRPFVDEQRGKPKGRRLRYAVGELLLCTRCTGAWSALGLVALRVHSPAAGRTVSAVLAASAGNDLLQATFSYLCAHANAEQKRAEDPAPGAAMSQQCGLMAQPTRTTCHASDGKIPGPATVRAADPPGVPGRVKLLWAATHRPSFAPSHGATGTSTDVKLTLPARPENVSVIRHVLGAFAEALRLPDDLVEDLRLAVTEACTNVVRHAYPPERHRPGRDLDPAAWRST